MKNIFKYIFITLFLVIFFAAFSAVAQIPDGPNELKVGEGLYNAEIYVDNGVYKKTTKRWTDAISAASFNSTSWIWNLEGRDKLHKNKRRDTILVVPDTAIPEDITLIVWFHGLNGFKPKTFGKRLVPQMEDLVSSNNSFAVAIPEMPWSINTSTRHGRQGKVWLKPGELERYIDSLKERLEIWAILKYGQSIDQVRVIFVGHSAGGSAIKASAKEGGLCRVSPEAIVWSDASYGRWLDSAWNGCIKNMNKDTELHILVRKWDPPYKSAERAMRFINRHKNGPNVLYQVLSGKDGWTHGRIGNNAISIANLFPPGC